MHRYPIRITPCPDGSYFATVPDFPSFPRVRGATLDHVLSAAYAAAEQQIATLRRAGQRLPDPSRLDRRLRASRGAVWSSVELAAPD